jgi:predicted secreted hydrolase
MGFPERTVVRSLAMSWLLLIAALVTAAGIQDPDEGSELSRLLSSDNTGFSHAIDPRHFSFPEDHGPHDGFRNEWWYMTGNLDASDGRRFGFELTIFRFALSPGHIQSESAWRSNHVFIAHFALSDPEGKQFLVAERASRGSAGLAGAQSDPFRVWIDDWGFSGASDGKSDVRWRVRASEPDFAIDLIVDATRSPVLNGTDGLSQKSAERGNASYYYSISRWRTSGTVRLGQEAIQVSGLSWLDREWSSSALAKDQIGWDWFALQLSDGSDLMFYNLRKTDGSQDEHSSGTYVAPNGEVEHLDRNALTIEVVDQWASPDGDRYPSRWRIRIPAYDLHLDIQPVMADQELFTTVRYWEGAVDVDGNRNGNAINGRGYVELTGYADSEETR